MKTAIGLAIELMGPRPEYFLAPDKKCMAKYLTWVPGVPNAVEVMRVFSSRNGNELLLLASFWLN